MPTTGMYGVDAEEQLRNVRLFEVHVRRTWRCLVVARRVGHVLFLLLCLNALYSARGGFRAVQRYRRGECVDIRSAPSSPSNVTLERVPAMPSCARRSLSEQLARHSTLSRTARKSCRRPGPLSLMRSTIGWLLRGIVPLWLFTSIGLYRVLLLESQLYLSRLNRVLSLFHIVFSRSAGRLHKAERHPPMLHRPAYWEAPAMPRGSAWAATPYRPLATAYPSRAARPE